MKMALSVEEIRRRASEQRQKTTIALACLHQNRLRFHGEVIPSTPALASWMYRGRQSVGGIAPLLAGREGVAQALTDFLAMVQNLIPKDKFETFKNLFRFPVITNEVLAVAYRDGKEVARKAIRTAGKAHHIELTAYSQSIAADGEALNYVTATIVDADGNVCPHANHRLYFAAEGAACVLATDAGDQRETECFLRPDKKALAGMLVCCLRSNGEKGNATVSCTAEGLESATLTFDCI